MSGQWWFCGYHLQTITVDVGCMTSNEALPSNDTLWNSGLCMHNAILTCECSALGGEYESVIPPVLGVGGGRETIVSFVVALQSHEQSITGYKGGGAKMYLLIMEMMYLVS